MSTKQLSKSELNKALFNAAKNGELDNVKKFILNGANVNTKDIYGWTSSMLAYLNGHIKTLEFLLNNGADVNAKNNGGWTSLMHVSEYNDIKTAQILINSGADINTKDNYGKTPLMRASELCNIEIIHLLLDNGVDIDAKNKAGKTAEDLAREHGHNDLGDMLNTALRSKILKEINEQLEHNERIISALRRKDNLSMLDREFLDLLLKD